MKKYRSAPTLLHPGVHTMYMYVPTRSVSSLPTHLLVYTCGLFAIVYPPRVICCYTSYVHVLCPVLVL